jgi:dipeptidase E
MQNTNDMPLFTLPVFKLWVLFLSILMPIDPDTQTKHMGETRETRIKEFHSFNTIPVLGLREGSWLRLKEKLSF